MQLADRILMLNKSTQVIGIEIVNRIKRQSKVGQQQVTCVNGGFASLLKGSSAREGMAAWSSVPCAIASARVCENSVKLTIVNFTLNATIKGPNKYTIISSDIFITSKLGKNKLYASHKI